MTPMTLILVLLLVVILLVTRSSSTYAAASSGPGWYVNRRPIQRALRRRGWRRLESRAGRGQAGVLHTMLDPPGSP